MSLIYRYLNTPYEYEGSNSGLAKWQTSNPALTPSVLLQTLKLAYKCLPSARYVEMSLKVIHRAYLTPLRGHRMGLYDTSACFKCGSPEADLYHCLWSCPRIQGFWDRIREFAVQHLVDTLPCDAQWALFGHVDVGAQESYRRNLRLLYVLASAGRKAILQVWNQPGSPTLHLFLDKLTFVMKMDWVEAAQQRERKVKAFFLLWGGLISILPPHIKDKINTCFRSTTWYQEQVLLGSNLVEI